MSVDSVSGLTSLISTATSTTDASDSSAMDSIGKDDFLLLLVTQLQNQDPLDPMDNTEFVSQLAQFSALEGITNLNTTMEDVSDSIGKMQTFSTASLVGRSVMIEGNSFEYSDEPVTLGYTLSGDASTVTVQIYDSEGNAIRKIDLGSALSGDYEGSWDGTDDYGDSVGEGSYTFYVEAKDSDGYSVDVATYVTGSVQSVSISDGDATLRVNDAEVSEDDVRTIY